VLDDLLSHIKKHDGVWFARGCDVAQFWLTNNAGATVESTRA